MKWMILLVCLLALAQFKLMSKYKQKIRHRHRSKKKADPTHTYNIEKRQELMYGKINQNPEIRKVVYGEGLTNNYEQMLRDPNTYFISQGLKNNSVQMKDNIVIGAKPTPRQQKTLSYSYGELDANTTESYTFTHDMHEMLSNPQKKMLLLGIHPELQTKNTRPVEEEYEDPEIIESEEEKREDEQRAKDIRQKIDQVKVFIDLIAGQITNGVQITKKQMDIMKSLNNFIHDRDDPENQDLQELKEQLNEFITQYVGNMDLSKKNTTNEYQQMVQRQQELNSRLQQMNDKQKQQNIKRQTQQNKVKSITQQQLDALQQLITQSQNRMKKYNSSQNQNQNQPQKYNYYVVKNPFQVMSNSEQVQKDNIERINQIQQRQLQQYNKLNINDQITFDDGQVDKGQIDKEQMNRKIRKLKQTDTIDQDQKSATLDQQNIMNQITQLQKQIKDNLNLIQILNLPSSDSKLKNKYNVNEVMKQTQFLMNMQQQLIKQKQDVDDNQNKLEEQQLKISIQQKLKDQIESIDFKDEIKKNVKDKYQLQDSDSDFKYQTTQKYKINQVDQKQQDNQEKQQQQQSDKHEQHNSGSGSKPELGLGLDSSKLKDMEFTGEKLKERDSPEQHKIVLQDLRLKQIKELVSKLQNKFAKSKLKLKKKKQR